MSTAVPETIYLKNYTAPHYLIDSVNLHFNLSEEQTQVTACLVIQRALHTAKDEPLVLNGEQLLLKSVLLDGVDFNHYKVTATHLTLFNVPDQFSLQIETIIKPQENTALEGLYQSNGNYCTQCEAHGFRRITYFLDRPDVMAVFTTTIAADKQRYPVLLSNGNLIASGEQGLDRHWATWHDPFKKPCYLFALVAGDLTMVEDRFITRSNREIALRIYVEPGNQDKCQHAMTSLKRAMRWDEQVYDREYDLDIFMIVAVSDFNMGAMENKGLNIFNAKYILANPDTATDSDFGHIEAVVAHEYFHNWTGNRITCRDWFQLSLKEGLTVFRDQEFSADMNSRPVQRIKDVRTLRTVQFVEDAGPLAHPIRPDSYIEMNNFYTATVYEKGAEVIRMLHTLLGAQGFQQGMQLYFARHDGQAVTCDDFINAMQDANNIDLQQFRLWYSQAGTPQLTISEQYNAALKTYTLSIKQSCPSTPGQVDKPALHIPLTMALFNQQGQPLGLRTTRDALDVTEITLAIKDKQQEFCFIDIAEPPIVSLLRNFSAPVKLNSARTEQQLILLMQHDTDLFNRWEASQQLASQLMLALIADYQQGKTLQLNQAFVTALRTLLIDKSLDKALLAQILILPTEVYLGGLMSTVAVEAIAAVHRFVREQLAQQLRTELLAVYSANKTREAYQLTAQAIAQRALKNSCLSYLMLLHDEHITSLIFTQFQHADNMTDEFAALQALVHSNESVRETAITDFYQKWQHNPLVVDKWFTVQATADVEDTLSRIQQLLHHPSFTYTNPNKVRALIGAFASSNFNRFHHHSGVGYQFLAEQVIAVNHLNPQVAARLVEPLTRWQRYDATRQTLLRTQLERILNTPQLSKDVYELVAKSLG